MNMASAIAQRTEAPPAEALSLARSIMSPKSSRSSIRNTSLKDFQELISCSKAIR